MGLKHATLKGKWRKTAKTMQIRPETNWTNMILEKNCKTQAKSKQMQTKSEKNANKMQKKCKSDPGPTGQT